MLVLNFNTGSLTPVTHEVAERNFNLGVCSSISAPLCPGWSAARKNLRLQKYTRMLWCQRRHNFQRSDALATALNLPANVCGGEPSEYLYKYMYFLPSHCFSEMRTWCQRTNPQQRQWVTHTWEWEPKIFHPPNINPRAYKSSRVFASRETGEKKTRRRIISPVTDLGGEANKGLRATFSESVVGRNLRCRFGFVLTMFAFHWSRVRSSEGWKLNWGSGTHNAGSGHKMCSLLWKWKYSKKR